MPQTLKARCSWVNLDNPLYITYHDHEWGQPIFDDQKLFELLILEGAQAGLNWETILNKREAYRQCFAGFDPVKVAKFTQARQEKLLKNPGIVRNRLKVASAVTNAQAFMKVQKEFGTFSDFIWGYVNHKPIINRFDGHDLPAQTELSQTISKDLKKLGFKFVGPTIMYAYMQAIGMVDDHALNCYKRAKPWYIYIIECADKSLYTGISTDVEARFKTHHGSPQGAKYLKGKGPLTLVFSQEIGTKSHASKLEYAIKKLNRADKLNLILTGILPTI